MFRRQYSLQYVYEEENYKYATKRVGIVFKVVAFSHKSDRSAE